mmetsp:Transcript_6995/g.15266  ORF Transcript_6995/g.15266 Transcript_6995/m.15266 type:complete len:501 (+) Transcript_6995:95-1597(+)
MARLTSLSAPLSLFGWLLVLLSLITTCASHKIPLPTTGDSNSDHARLIQTLGTAPQWPIDIHDLNHAINHGTDYIVRHCNEHGKFTYLADTADPSRYDDSVKYNMLRHSGAIYALGIANARRPNRQIVDAMQRAVDFLKRESMAPVMNTKLGTVKDGDGERLLAVWSSETISGQKGQPPTAKLGGAGLALIALTSLEAVRRRSTPLDDMRSLARFVLFMQNDDGGFVSKYVPRKGGMDHSFVSLYYPGEAALGLLSLYEIDPDPRWLKGAAKAISYLYNLRRDLPLDNIEPDHWALIATSKLLSIMDGRDHDDCSQRAAVDHATKVCQSMVLGPDQLLKNGGCLVGDHRTCPTSTRIEGYAASLTFLPNATVTDQALRKLVEYNMDAGVRYLLRAQRVADDLNEASRGMMVGSFPGVYPPETDRSKECTEVRIDYVQHALSAMIGYERERFHHGKVRVSMLYRVAEAIGWGLRRLVLTILALALAVGVMLFARPKAKKLH